MASLIDSFPSRCLKPRSDRDVTQSGILLEVTVDLSRKTYFWCKNTNTAHVQFIVQGCFARAHELVVTDVYSNYTVGIDGAEWHQFYVNAGSLPLGYTVLELKLVEF